jgi:hypothetical protein
MVIKTFCSILQILDESFHRILPFDTVYLMLQSEPSAGGIVPQSTICKDWLLTIPVPKLFEEAITYENGPFPR